MAKNEYPKATGSGWYELSDGSKVQGEDEAKKAEADLSNGGDTQSSGSDQDATETAEDSAARNRADDGTGLESLAVDREVTVTEEGQKIGDEEDDPRRFTGVAGKEVVGRAESGEPVVLGGVEGVTHGIPKGQQGVNDPNLGVAATTGAALDAHEATRDQWYGIDPEDSDGSPADRLRAGQPQNPGAEEDPTPALAEEN